MRTTLSKGIAGQVAVSVEEDDGATLTVVGSVYGGPVVLVTSGGEQVFVTDPERFGRFADDPVTWAERFAAA